MLIGRCDVDLATLNNTVKMYRADLGEANRLKCDPQHLLAFFRDAGLDEEVLEVFFCRPLGETQKPHSRRNYDVFVSFKNRDDSGDATVDSALAKEIHSFLSARNLRVFMSETTLEELGTSKFKESIDEALDGARVLVVVATSADHTRAPWVSYEWSGFVNDILSKVKPNGEVFTYLQGMRPTELPRGLRQVQSFSHDDGGLERLYRYLCNLLH